MLTKWLGASILCSIAFSAQAATWSFENAQVTTLDFGGVPTSDPVVPIRGTFTEQAGTITQWDFTAGSVRFTSTPGTCTIPGTSTPCFEAATLTSPKSILFDTVQGQTPLNDTTLDLLVTHPLNSGLRTIGIVPGSFDVANGFGGSLLQVGGQAPNEGVVTGSISQVPEPQIDAVLAVGLVGLTALGLRARRRSRR